LSNKSTISVRKQEAINGLIDTSIIPAYRIPGFVRDWFFYRNYAQQIEALRNDPSVLVVEDKK